MRILFLTSEVPYPPRSGGTIKSMSVLQHLRRNHEVHVLCFRRTPLSPEQVAWTAEAGPVAAVLHRRDRSVPNLLRSYAAGVPLSVLRNRSRRMSRLASESLASGRFDAAFADGWLMAQYVPATFPGLRLLHEHNAEHVMWRRQVDLERSFARRTLMRLEYGRVRSYEAAIARGFDVVFAVSDEDRRALEELGTRPGSLRLLPNIPQEGLLDLPALRPSAEPVLLFLGTLGWPPNVEGLRRFLRSGFPALRARRPDARLVVAGAGAPRCLERLASETPGVEFTGPVVDPEPLYRQARVFVDVGMGGSGTRVKVLNAMARGLPVASLPWGVEGLGVAPGEHALVGRDEAELIDLLGEVLDNDARWHQLSEAGRKLVRKRYVPEIAFAELDATLAASRGDLTPNPGYR
jgi:glycosyltransferase involved in cell wall biosynthesis